MFRQPILSPVRPPIRTSYHQLSDYEVGDVIYYTRSDINDSDYGIIIDIDDSGIHTDGPTVFRSPVGPYRKSFDFIYNNGKFYDKDYDYEITIQNLGPPEITPEEIRQTIIEQLDSIETSNLPPKTFLVSNDQMAGYQINVSTFPIMIEAKTKLGAIVAWLDWNAKILGTGWFSDRFIDMRMIDFIGKDADEWLTVLKEFYGNKIQPLEVGEIIKFPSSLYTKVARNQ